MRTLQEAIAFKKSNASYVPVTSRLMYLGYDLSCICSVAGHPSLATPAEAPLRAFCFVLQKITACVMVSVSYRSQSVSNFHCSFSTATKNCLMPTPPARCFEAFSIYLAPSAFPTASPRGGYTQTNSKPSGVKYRQ